MTEDFVALKAAEMMMRMQSGLVELLAKIISAQEAEEIAAAPAGPPKAKGKSIK